MPTIISRGFPPISQGETPIAMGERLQESDIGNWSVEELSNQLEHQNEIVKHLHLLKLQQAAGHVASMQKGVLAFQMKPSHEPHEGESGMEMTSKVEQHHDILKKLKDLHKLQKTVETISSLQKGISAMQPPPTKHQNEDESEPISEEELKNQLEQRNELAKKLHFLKLQQAAETVASMQMGVSAMVPKKSDKEKTLTHKGKAICINRSMLVYFLVKCCINLLST